MAESITTSASFQARLLRSERLRAVLLGVVWAVALISLFIRRIKGDVLLANDSLFVASVALFTAAVLFQGYVIAETIRAMHSGKPGPSWRWVLSAGVDIAIPVAAIGIMHRHTPIGQYEALTGPPLLGIPLVTMLSILRLKPVISLATGIAGAVAHWMLAADAVRTGGVEVHHWPMLFMYGMVLCVTGVAAWFIARQARGHLSEAVAEAIESERSQRALESIEHDLEIARDIQRGLLPGAAPEIEGFDIAGMARPAQQTGGDYYDWQRVQDGRLVVALADVTGHGIGPALVMAVCRAYARASAIQTPDSAELLTRINALISADLAATGRFITMVIALVSSDGRIELVSAGHGPTLLYRARGGTVETFGGDGPPLGVIPDERYGPTREFTLERGDVLVMLTDGFMEWKRAGDGEQFGIERLTTALAASARGTAQAILEGVDQAVRAFAAGTPQADDTTAVVIKRV